MPEKTVIDNFLETFESALESSDNQDTEAIKVYLEKSELDDIPNSLKYSFIEKALDKKKFELFTIILNKYRSVFLLEETQENLISQLFERVLNRQWIGLQNEGMIFINLLVESLVSQNIPLVSIIKAALRVDIFDRGVFTDLCNKFFPPDSLSLYPIGLTEAIVANNHDAALTILELLPGTNKINEFLLPQLRKFHALFRYCLIPVKVAVLCFAAQYEAQKEFLSYWNQTEALSAEDLFKIMQACKKTLKIDADAKLLSILETPVIGTTYLVLGLDQIPQNVLNQFLRNYCSKINENNDLGKTLLHLLCEQYVVFPEPKGRYLEFINDLLARGADPNKVDQNGYSPLHLAFFKKELQLMCLLRDYGADPTLSTGQLESVNVLVDALEDDNIRIQMLSILKVKKVPAQRAVAEQCGINFYRKRPHEPLPTQPKLETYQEILARVTKQPRTYKGNTDYHNQFHSQRKSILRAIKERDEIFYELIEENLAFITETSMEEILKATVKSQSYDMLDFVLKKGAASCLAKPEVAIEILYSAITAQTAEQRIIPRLLEAGIEKVIDLSVLAQLNPNDKDWCQLLKSQEKKDETAMLNQEANTSPILKMS